MKKMIALLLFISLLFSTALADVASQVGAPATYQADYYSNTKKTNVHPVKGRADEIEGGQQVAIFRLIQQGKKLVTDAFIDDDCAAQHEQQALLFCVHSAHLTVKRRTVAVLV